MESLNEVKMNFWLDDREEEEDLQLNEMMKNLSESFRTESFQVF